MPRPKATGSFETREKLEIAVWEFFHTGMSDTQIAKRVEVSNATVAKILRESTAPVGAKPPELLSYPMRAHRRQVLNRGGEEVALAKTEGAAETIVDALNETHPVE